MRLILFAVYCGSLVGLLLSACNIGGKSLGSRKDDTVFLKKNVQQDGSGQKIYIDPGTNTGYLEMVSRFDDADSSNLNTFFSEIKKNRIRLTNHDVKGLEGVWVPIYIYKSAYYRYVPSDQGSKQTWLVNDSVASIYYMDGYMPMAIQAIRRSDSSKQFQVDLESIGHKLQLYVYVLDAKTGLAVWKFKEISDKEFTYQLMAPIKKSVTYPVIVNESTKKELEVEFEKPDFKKLVPEG